jgi:hypothetical protein
MQRLTNLCSVLNDMEPICVLNHVFVLREVKHLSCFFFFFGPLSFCYCLFNCLDDKEIGYIWQICQLLKKKNNSSVLA